MSDQNDNKNYVNYGQAQGGSGHSPCSLVWKGLCAIGAALTFIRNLIANLIMLLVIAFIVIAYNAATSFKEEAEAVLSGEAGIPAQMAEAQILYLPLSGNISEIPFGTSQFETLYRRFNDNLSGTQSHELTRIERALDAACDAENIKLVLLDLEGMRPISMTAASRIAGKLMKLNEAGKETAVTAVNYTQGAYIIAAAASKIYLDPLGGVDLKGISLSSLYYKSLLDKAELTPYVFKAGHFKSAVEPVTQDGMSPDVKAEYQEIASNLWSIYEKKLHVRKALSRSIILPEASDYIKQLELYQGDSAMMQFENNLADTLMTPNALYAQLAADYSADPDDPLMPLMMDYRDFLRLQPKESLKDERIAVVYGVGSITQMANDVMSFSADNVTTILHSLAGDDSIKAVVLYINSPGGDAAASEDIRRSLQQLREQGKKVVVSIQGMGASGAYWVSTASDKILATEESIVGSIGVFAVSMGFHKLLNSIGVYQDGVATHEFARTPVAEEMGPNMRRYYELSVEHTYKTFINLAAASRGLSPDNYLSYAEGQIFLAQQAQDLGLIDGIGSFEDAQAEAAKLLGGTLEDYSVVTAVLPQDERLSALESFIFRSSQTLLPEPFTRALFELKLMHEKSEAPLKERIELSACMQQPLI